MHSETHPIERASVEQADLDAEFLKNLAVRIFKNATPAMGFDQGDVDQLYRIAAHRQQARDAGFAEGVARAAEDAARWRALMACPRIKMQGSAGVDPVTGARKYPHQPGSVHFGAEFWPVGAPGPSGQSEPTWGRFALVALTDDILELNPHLRALPAEANEGRCDG